MEIGSFYPISTHIHPFTHFLLKSWFRGAPARQPYKNLTEINTFAAAWGAQFVQKRENVAFPWNSVVYGKNDHFSVKVRLLMRFPASDQNGGPKPPIKPMV